MKFIELKTVEIEDQKFDYRRTLAQTLRVRPDGIDLEEMRRALKILEKIESAQSWLVLEDAEFDYLVSRVRAQKWMSVTKEVLDFADSVINAASEEPEKYLAGKAAGV